MSDGESIKKMLRSVLQSNKDGVAVSRLQTEYWSLCGEFIPFKNMGYHSLDEYLGSIPSVVRMERRMGETKCFAAVCKETANIAQLVAKQKTAKKPGRSQLVNCRMRAKPSNPYMYNAKPSLSLRQPSGHGGSGWKVKGPRFYKPHGGCSALGDYRKLGERLGPAPPTQHRGPSTLKAQKQPIQPVKIDNCQKTNLNYQKLSGKTPAQTALPQPSQSVVYDPILIKKRLSQLLVKHSSGMWLSKLPEIYKIMFNELLHHKALIDIEKWTDICLVEQPASTNRSDRLVYPPLPPKLSRTNYTASAPKGSPTKAPVSILTPSPTPKVTNSSLAKPTFLFPPQPASTTLVSQHSPASPQAVAPLPGRSSSTPPHVFDATSSEDSHSSPVSPLPSPTVEWKLNLTSSPLNCSLDENHNQPLSSTWNPSINSFKHDSPSTSCLISSTAPETFKHDSPFTSCLISSTPPETLPATPNKSSSPIVHSEVRQKLDDLLSKYSQGLWAHALPKLFLDTYKTPFPEDLQTNLSLLLDACTVDYPMPENKEKAILYSSSITDHSSIGSQGSPLWLSSTPPSGVRIVSSVAPLPLVLPTEQYPSVLVTDAKNSNTVIVRYVGENYSKAQETLEVSMVSFYSQGSAHKILSSPVIGQLAAVRGDGEDELARAQVIEVTTFDKVKVYYVDHGFLAEVSRSSLLELHQDFLSLPFQATCIRLAGLELFSSHPLVVSTLDNLAVGKILLLETVEVCRDSGIPLAVLYDTSQDDDVNINAVCRLALQDKTLNPPLTVNCTYQNVSVTNVCSDGTVYCQLLSRGTVKLNELLEKIELFFSSQVTSESLVSRPFCGKLCLARHKGKLSRVEITNLHDSRVMDIVFIDLGVTASVEVTDIREIPPPFLYDLTVIPPQAIRCCLADLIQPAGDLSPEAHLWLKETVLDTVNCSIKILKMDHSREGRLIHIYLYTSADSSQEMDNSINHQLSQSQLLRKQEEPNNNSICMPTGTLEAGDLSGLKEKLCLDSPAESPFHSALHGSGESPRISTPAGITTPVQKPLGMPAAVELPQAGQSMDVFVPVACHPGYFVIQPWQELYKLVVLMGEMVLYYNQTAASRTDVQKGEIYAAKVDKSWYRVLVKGLLNNGLVSVYQLDYGRYELVSSARLQPLIDEFRQLPFQAITAQLAGVEQKQWSEEASMVFRNHVENRALVAQVESVHEESPVKGEIREHRVTVFLVDTTEEMDLWIHNIMADVAEKLSGSA